MPSRKKAKGRRARKEEQTAQFLREYFAPLRGNCKHFAEEIENFSRGDFIACGGLVYELANLNNSEPSPDFPGLCPVGNVFTEGPDRRPHPVGMAFKRYLNNIQGNNEREELLRVMLLSKATDVALMEANEADLLDQEKNNSPLCFILMLVFMEIMEKSYVGNDKGGIFAEVEITFAAIRACPRAIYHFIHRRNSCNCLQELYYGLKDSTSRTTYCYYCKIVKHVKEIAHQCSKCKLTQYCSYECGVADWTEHKKDCKRLRESGK